MTRKMKSEDVKANFAILVLVVCLFVDTLNNHKFSNRFFSNLSNSFERNFSNLFTSPKQFKTVFIPTPRGEYGIMNIPYSSVEILKTSPGYIKFRITDGTVIEHNGSYQIRTSSP